MPFQETNVKSASHGAPPPLPSSANYRVTCATVIVAALHLVLAALVLTKHDRIPVVAPESRVITAALLQSAPVAAAAIVQSTPTPPATRVKPKERTEPKVRPAPAPVPLTPARSDLQVHAQTSAAATEGPTTPAVAVAQASEAPQPGKPVITLNAPKNVSHLDCRIVTPDYPNRSKRLGETGTAYVRFVVGLTGQIEDVELKKSSGFDRLDGAALDAMRASSCEPYLENGAPVRAAYTQPFNFALGG
jgi:periplasmic protein TonB